MDKLNEYKDHKCIITKLPNGKKAKFPIIERFDLSSQEKSLNNGFKYIGYGEFESVYNSRTGTFVPLTGTAHFYVKKSIFENEKIELKSEKRQKREYPITPEVMAGLLHGIHDHHPKTEKIIYHEDDIIKLLTKLGYPKPKWGISLDLKKFKAIKIKLDN